MQQLSFETLKYIEDKKLEYEQKYQINIYMWLVRKSFLRGLGRKSSDLDIAFIFDNKGNEDRTILFERADRRVEIQCWSLQDVLDVVVQNKLRALENKYFDFYYKNYELQHYILDYYNGFYCGLNSKLAGDDKSFWDECSESFWNMYEPLVPTIQCYQDLKSQIKKIEMGYLISLNEYLNAVWSGMAGLHLLSGKQPGDVEILELADYYLNVRDSEQIKELVHYFKKTIQKQSNYVNELELNTILYKLLCLLEEQIDKYKVEQLDMEQDIAVIQNYLNARRRG